MCRAKRDVGREFSLKQSEKPGGRWSAVHLSEGHGIQAEIDGPPGQALADLAHQQQIGRSREHKAPRCPLLVYRLFNRGEQSGNLLHLIEDNLLGARPQRGRLVFGLSESIQVVEGD